MKKLSFLLAFLCTIVANAYDVKIDGICYNLTSKTRIAEVTYGETEYTGAVNIPPTISHGGKEYTVTSIGQDAFNGCMSLQAVTIPDDVESIGLRAFSYCFGLTKIAFPSKLKTIGNSAFYGCTGLTTLTFPEGLESIGSNAFSRCENLTSIVLPESVTKIGDRAFTQCTKLTDVKLPNSITHLGIVFEECTSLKTIELPQGLKSMRATFAGCTALTEIVLPNSLELIDINTFKECTSLKTVTVGTGLQQIESGAFYHCKDLEDFYCYSPVVEKVELEEGEEVMTTVTPYPKAADDIFDDALIKYATLHVPDATLEWYAEFAPWSGFGKIVGLDGTELTKCENPVISYADGKLSVTCATECSKCITTVTDTSIKTYYDAEIPLTLTYTVTAYATAVGHQNSDVVTATLCWVNAEPETQGLTDDIKEAKGNVVIIQNRGGLISLTGLDEGISVSIYTADGQLEGTSVAKDGQAFIGTSIFAGNVVILKFGNQSAKYLMR